MNDQTKLTKDQEKRIAATLKRIRGGLRRNQSNQFEEPTHIFKPEAINAKDK